MVYVNEILTLIGNPAVAIGYGLEKKMAASMLTDPSEFNKTVLLLCIVSEVSQYIHDTKFFSASSRTKLHSIVFCDCGLLMFGWQRPHFQ